MTEFGGLGRIWQNAADCRLVVGLLIAESVETGGRVYGVTGVSRDRNQVRARTREEGFKTSKTRILGVLYKEQSLYYYFHDYAL